MATPIEESIRRTQRAAAFARTVRLAAEAQRDQAIIDAEVAITLRDPHWRAARLPADNYLAGSASYELS